MHLSKISIEAYIMVTYAESYKTVTSKDKLRNLGIRDRN